MPGLGGVLPTPYAISGTVPGTGAIGSRFEQADDFKILALAARKRRGMAAVNLFEQAMDTDFAYAQAWVFNPTSADLYTQNWQSQLTPATFMNRPSEVESAMQGHTTSDFRDLRAMFGKSGNTDAFQALNQH